jgi:hypothetical protein
VPFIGKVDQTAWNSLSLERCEERKTFGIRDAIIQFTDDYQVGSPEIPGEEVR